MINDITCEFKNCSQNYKEEGKKSERAQSFTKISIQSQFYHTCSENIYKSLKKVAQTLNESK